MGMDVYGIEPTTEAGRYFRASIWGWRPLWERMNDLCGDFLSQEMLRAMSFNDGAGPQDQATCTKIADRLEQWLHADSHSEYRLDARASLLRVTSDGCLALRDASTEEAASASRSPYSVTREEIAEFIEFLRNCGGFSVW